ncbi:MAG: C25 family cysteine peptidase [Kiritimatiellia bacterium]
MRLLSTLILLCALLVPLLGARGDDIALECTFAAPVLSGDGEGSLNVSIADCFSFSRPGEPVMPVRIARILLPSDAVVRGVSAEPVVPEERLELDAPVAFGRTPIPLSEPDSAVEDLPNLAVYASDGPYPAQRAELVSVQRLHGHAIAIVRVFPAQFLPLDSLLVFCPRIRVSVTLDRPARAPRRGAQAASVPASTTAARLACVREFVDNPEALPADAAVAPVPLATPVVAAGAPEAHDYLLVTSAALTNAFQPLVDHKVACGLAVKVATMEEILASFSGVDAAAKLRAFIAHAYENWGVAYVLLGGDVSTVPHRGAYARNVDRVDNALPCDLYFACLDGTWNSDGDDLWGEPTDGEGGGDVDLLAEVHVGRAPVETPAEAANFVAKTLAYATTRHPHVETARFMGEILNVQGEIVSQGGAGLDALLSPFYRHDVSWLDDRPVAAQTWNTADAVAALNASPHHVVHNGHANANWALRMGKADIPLLTNPHPFLLASTGCHAGAFDESDCFAEEIVKLPNHGAFAAVMNSRYGWYMLLDPNRFSGEFLERFFKRLNLATDTTLGAAHQLGKQDLVGLVETDGVTMTYRWCYFEQTLFGDPHLMVQPSDDIQAHPREGLAASGYQGAAFAPVEQVFTVTNRGFSNLSWTVAHTSLWLAASPMEGVLGPWRGTNVTVVLSDAVKMLPEGVHSAPFVFANTATGRTRERGFTLTVLPPPGEIVVTDSTAPADDGIVFFGSIVQGLSGTASLCISNTHSANTLVVHDIALVGDPSADALGFSWADSPAFPISVPPQEAVALTLAYAPSGLGLHTATAVITSNDKDEPEQRLTLWGHGDADFLEVSPCEGLTASGHPGGPFSPAGCDFVVKNNSAYSIVWSAHHPAWVDVAPSSGSLAGQAAATVSATFNAAAAALSEGVHAGSLVFSNATTSIAHALPLTLDVFTTPTIAFEPPTIAITNRLGHVGTAALRVGNAAGADAGLDFAAMPCSSEPPAWLGVDPATVAGVVPGEGTNLVVSADAGMRTAGVYEGVVVFATNDRFAPSTNVVATMVVLPDDFGVLEADGFVAEGFDGGPFEPGGTVYTLTNAGPAALGWAASADADWLDVSPVSGELAPGASATVAVALAASAGTLGAGAYAGAVAFSNCLTTAVQFRTAGLTVKERRLDHFAWDPVPPLQHVGEPFTATVRAVDNAGDLYPAFTDTVSLFITNGAYSFHMPYDGTNFWNYPLRAYNRMARTQVIYLAEDLDGPALIMGLWLYIGYRPGPLNDWTIRLKHTTLGNYSSGSRNWETDGWTVVCRTNAEFNKLGWVSIPFATPFVYNGKDNLLIDYSFRNATYTRDGYCLSTGVPTARSLHQKSDSKTDDPLLWSGTAPSGSISTNIPNVILERFGIVPLEPTQTPAFTGGVWTGEVTGWEDARAVRVFTCDDKDHWGLSAPFDILYRTVSLDDALDNPAVVWRSGGSSNWWGQTVVTQDGVDAARSGRTSHRQASWLETNVTGPGSVLFWWRVSSEAGWDWLEFHLNGVINDRLSGETGWVPKTLALGPGTHAFRWRYVKDAADFDPVGHDCGWVDRFIGPSPSELPLLWLDEHGLATDGSADDVDSDGDRLTNREEWIAGTVPTNAASTLMMQDAVPLPGEDGTIVRWQSVEGRRYWVESADALGGPAPFLPFVSNIVGQAGSTEILDTRPAPEGKRFYRVGVQRE